MTSEKESEEAPHVRVAKKEDAKLWDILIGPKEPRKIVPKPPTDRWVIAEVEVTEGEYDIPKGAKPLFFSQINDDLDGWLTYTHKKKKE